MVVLGSAAAYLMWSRAPDRSRVAHPGGAASGGAETAGSGALAVPGFGGRPAIAVLPFDNLSPDPEQAFFADGLAEDLITRLSTWRAFPVIARNSSFQYRGGNRDLKRVSAELGARYVVEGSVRRAGSRIRVTAQLIDAPPTTTSAETYDREITDVFALQDEISATIAASLVGDLTRAEGERARQKGTENLEAWSLYQLGLQRADRLTPADMAEARRLFERAVALEWHVARRQPRRRLLGDGALRRRARSGPAADGRASGYFWGYLYVAENAVALGRIDEARATIAEGRRVQPDLSLELIQRGIGVSRPAIDARRNAALRQAGLE